MRGGSRHLTVRLLKCDSSGIWKAFPYVCAVICCMSLLCADLISWSTTVKWAWLHCHQQIPAGSCQATEIMVIRCNLNGLRSLDGVLHFYAFRPVIWIRVSVVHSSFPQLSLTCCSLLLRSLHKSSNDTTGSTVAFRQLQMHFMILLPPKLTLYIQISLY